MNKKRLLIATAISLAVTVLVVFGIFRAVEKMNEPENTVAIAVAKTEIKAGTILQPDLYEYVEVPEDEYIASYVTYEPVVTEGENGEKIERWEDVLKGKEAKETIYQGERIMKARISGISIVNENDEESFKETGYRRMTYTATGVSNMAGQLKGGDRIDFWIRYKLQDRDNNDTIIVVDKILSNVPVVNAYNSNSQEVTNKNEASTTIELMLTQQQVQEFIKWRDMGKLTIVKVPADANLIAEKEVNRIKMSQNELIWEVLSMTEDEMNKDDIIKDEEQKENVGNYTIPDNTDDE